MILHENELILHENELIPQQYCDLWTAVGFPAPTLEQAERAVLDYIKRTKPRQGTVMVGLLAAKGLEQA